MPIAARLPRGVTSSIAVCAIGVTFIGVDPPPWYSGRCSLASGDVTPKCARMISVYRVPPRASRSSIFCIWNACLSELIVTAVAAVRSAYMFGALFNGSFSTKMAFAGFASVLFVDSSYVT